MTVVITSIRGLRTPVTTPMNLQVSPKPPTSKNKTLTPKPQQTSLKACVTKERLVADLLGQLRAEFGFGSLGFL